MGGFRAPNVLASSTDDLGGLLVAGVNLTVCFLVCFLPVILFIIGHFSKTGQVQRDIVYWGLVAYAALLFPLLFMSVTIIDSMSAWNPFNLITAFVKLQPQYLIFSAVFFGFLYVLHFLPNIENLSMFLLSRPMVIYTVFIGAHLLGRFYWLMLKGWIGRL